MRLAYLVNQYPKTSHTFVRREIRALEELGFSVERFTMRPTGDELVDPADLSERQRTRALLGHGWLPLFASFLAALCLQPLRLGRAIGATVRLGRRSPRGLLAHVAYLLEACLLRRWLSRSGADRLHAHFGTNAATVAMLCHLMGGPEFSFTVHGPEEFDDPRGLGLPEKIRACSFVVAISHFGRSQLMRWCEPRDWHKIRVHRCGVDPEFLSVRATPVPDTHQLVCVGRLCEQKGHLVLLDALALVKRRGQTFRMVLAGDGPLRSRIENRIRQLGLERDVHIAGWMSGDEIHGLLQSSRGMVLPSFAEGLPVVIMEALALGRPVISTFVAGIPELVRPGRCGWLAPAGDTTRLATAISRLLETPVPELTRMGADGAARARSAHDPRRIARDLARSFGAGPSDRYSPGTLETPIGHGTDDAAVWASGTDVAAAAGS